MKHLTITRLLLIGLFTSPLVSVADADDVADLFTGLQAYEKGDYKTALREWKPLAEQGHAGAQYNLGQMYRKGDGVPQDDKKAAQWYRLAAKQGDADAQYAIGVLYRTGRGVLQSYEESVKWTILAAKQGHVKAQLNLGLMYGQGDGVPQDYIRAYMWLNIAASAGEEKAKRLRDLLVKEMSKADITVGQKLAQKCIRSNYKDC